jgi:hypothetical protein
MALSELRHKEIDAEFQQIAERLFALAAELDPGNLPGNRYVFVGQETKLVAEQVKQLRHSLVIARLLER